MSTPPVAAVPAPIQGALLPNLYHPQRAPGVRASHSAEAFWVTTTDAVATAAPIKMSAAPHAVSLWEPLLWPAAAGVIAGDSSCSTFRRIGSANVGAASRKATRTVRGRWILTGMVDSPVTSDYVVPLELPIPLSARTPWPSDCVRISLLSGFAIPLRGLHVVLRHARTDDLQIRALQLIGFAACRVEVTSHRAVDRKDVRHVLVEPGLCRDAP